MPDSKEKVFVMTRAKANLLTEFVRTTYSEPHKQKVGLSKLVDVDDCKPPKSQKHALESIKPISVPI